MNLLPTFGFKGSILPVINTTDKLYLFIENYNNHRVLLNITSADVNKFVNIESKSSEIIRSGYYKPNYQLKVFYMGQELFDFSCDEINKEHLLFYSNYILKKEICVGEISFFPNFLDGLKLTPTSKNLQNLYIKIIDNDTNEIICEDNFLSNETYIFNNNVFVNYGISIYNINGQQIYNYNLNLKDKTIWIKLESISMGECIAWIPYVEEFRKKHQCKLLCTTYWNNLFINEYPDIEFIDSNEIIKESKVPFAIYKIKHDNTETDVEKTAFKSLKLEQKTTKLNEILQHIKENSISNTI